MVWFEKKWNRLHSIAPSDPFAATLGLRVALRATFLTNGLLSAIWVLLVPELKLRYGLADGEVGLILLAAGIGGAVAMPMAAAAMLRWGCRLTAVVATVVAVVGPPLVLPMGTAVGAGVVLLLYGLANGARSIALNAHAVRAETAGGRPVLSSFHAFFSMGGLVGAGASAIALDAGVETQSCLVALVIIVASINAAALPRLRPKSFDAAGNGTPKLGIPRGIVWILGLFCFVCYLGEGAVSGWSSNLMRFSRDCGPGEAGLAFTAFAGAMTLSRLVGDAVTRRLGPVAALRLGAGIAAVGMAIATLIPTATAGIVGFAILGLGAGNTVPIIFSAAGRIPGLSPSLSIPGVSTFGMAALLGGPAVIGIAADGWTLPTALFVVGSMYGIVALFARVVR